MIGKKIKQRIKIKEWNRRKNETIKHLTTRIASVEIEIDQLKEKINLLTYIEKSVKAITERQVKVEKEVEEKYEKYQSMVNKRFQAFSYFLRILSNLLKIVGASKPDYDAKKEDEYELGRKNICLKILYLNRLIFCHLKP